MGMVMVLENKRSREREREREIEKERRGSTTILSVSALHRVSFIIIKRAIFKFGFSWSVHFHSRGLPIKNATLFIS